MLVCFHSIDQNPPAAFEDAVKVQEQGGLARPVSANQRDLFARRNLQRNVIQRQLPIWIVV